MRNKQTAPKLKPPKFGQRTRVKSLQDALDCPDDQIEMFKHELDQLISKAYFTGMLTYI